MMVPTKSMEWFLLVIKTKCNFLFMIQLSWLCFSDSGYYYDDEKAAKKLVRIKEKKNCSMEIFNFNFKPTLFREVTGRNK